MAPDLSGLRAEMVRLFDEGEKDSLLGLVLGLLEKMATENSKLAFRLQGALRQLYRKKSERLSSAQLALFLSDVMNEEGAELGAPDAASSAASPAPSDTPKAEKPPVPPKRPKKRPFPDNLRREVLPIPVPESERTCGVCGAAKQPMGYEVCETWEFRPAEFFIVEERLEKCVCKKCEEGIVTAEPSASKPVERSRPGPGLLAQLVTAKCRDGLPLYRQSQIYKRSGIHLAPSTLGDWTAAAADLMLPLWKVAKAETLKRYLLSLDDTRMPVLDKESPNGIKRGHLWTYLGDEEAVGFCDYTPNWKGEAPQAVLAEFTGRCVQGDGYAGIDAFFQKPNAPKRAGCMDHCRRKFVAAFEAGHRGAAVVLDAMQKVYAVERQAREYGLGPENLLQRRQQLSRPLMDKLKASIAGLHLAATPKSALGKATTYAINQWATLCVFLEDGRVPLSNIHVERQQRRTALGRKNYLFAGSDEGAKRLAVLQTFVVLCDLLDTDVFEYLRDVLGRINDWPIHRLAELLPAAWLAEKKERQQLAAQVTPTLELAAVNSG